jgi:hypothetical protein
MGREPRIRRLGLELLLTVLGPHAGTAIMEKVKHTEPWFGIEQEYTLFEMDGAGAGGKRPPRLSEDSAPTGLPGPS